jgi:hypothetical protein
MSKENEMKTMLMTLLALVVLVGLAHGMGAKPADRTGDRSFDATLEKIGIEAKADTEGYLSRLGKRHGIAESEIRQAMAEHRLSAPDIYMATALAKATERPLLTIAAQYQESPGRSWGALAKDLGIKPGSQEFHALKQGAREHLDDMKAAAKSRREHERKQKKESRGKGNVRP